LRFTLLRATKPCEIKAGKMFVMSLETFFMVRMVILVIMLQNIAIIIFLDDANHFILYYGASVNAITIVKDRRVMTAIMS